MPIPRDPVEAEEQFDGVMRAAYPSWAPEPMDFMTEFRSAIAVLYAEVGELATRAGEEIFRYYGRGVASLPPTEETLAFGTATFTAQDTAGPYVIPEGLEITGRSPLGEARAFRTITTAIVLNGETTASVAVEAAEEGTEHNGIGGPAEFSEYVDYLTAVEFDAPTSGGEDREGDEPFLDRLGDELAIMSPRPILPFHFEVLARRLGAFRATAINGLDPVANTTSNAATMTVAIADEAGAAESGGVKTAVDVGLTALREVGWDVFVIDPTYATIAVTFAATSYPDADPDAVELAAIAAVQDYLDPATYGQREDTGEAREWLNDPTIRFLELAERLQRVVGLRFVDALTLGRVRTVTGVASTDLFTVTGHGLAAGDPFVFSDLTGGAGITAGQSYFVIASGLTADDFRVSATLGGSTINVTTDLTAGSGVSLQTDNVTMPGYAPLPLAGTVVGVVSP